MTKVLYITAHPNDETKSYSLAVGKAFIDTYREVNPDHDIINVDLYKENVPEIDVDVFSGWGKLQSGKDLMTFLRKRKQRFLAFLSYQNNSFQLINMFL